MSDQAGLPRLHALMAAAPPNCDVWTCGGGQTLAGWPAARLRVFSHGAHLAAALVEHLAGAVVGLRLYLVGAEGFIWPLVKLAMDGGLNTDEILVERAGTLARRVWCVHCRATTEDISTNVFACSGCGRPLFVRDHFSRRLAAFMGYQVDAEVPGDVPAQEIIYP